MSSVNLLTRYVVLRNVCENINIALIGKNDHGNENHNKNN